MPTGGMQRGMSLRLKLRVSVKGGTGLLTASRGVGRLGVPLQRRRGSSQSQRSIMAINVRSYSRWRYLCDVLIAFDRGWTELCRPACWPVGRGAHCFLALTLQGLPQSPTPNAWPAAARHKFGTTAGRNWENCGELERTQMIAISGTTNYSVHT